MIALTERIKLFIIQGLLKSLSLSYNLLILVVSLISMIHHVVCTIRKEYVNCIAA